MGAPATHGCQVQMQYLGVTPLRLSYVPGQSEKRLMGLVPLVPVSQPYGASKRLGRHYVYYIYILHMIIYVFV